MIKGYVWKQDNGKLALQKCPKCNVENYALNVLTGFCTWCGYEAQQKDVNDKTKEQTR